ncbi:hypothetical protein V6R21_20000 [Limibacter armeniacum]|uniref:hypothetical protein n=1 Tax=Limibacter armeniacum TaxID=466084 RepID=UPI002FE5B82A
MKSILKTTTDFLDHYYDEECQLMVTKYKGFAYSPSQIMEETIITQNILLMYQPTLWLVDKSQIQIHYSANRVVSTISEWVNFVHLTKLMKVAFVTGGNNETVHKYVLALLEEYQVRNLGLKTILAVFEDKIQAEEWLLFSVK